MENVHTVGEDFRAAGYDAALIGKAHFQHLRCAEEFSSLESYPLLQDLEFWRDFSEPFYGFNYVELTRNHADEAHVGQHYALWLEEKGCLDWRKYFAPPTGTTPPQFGRWNIPEELHYNTWIAERTNARLDRCREKDEPFFLWASFFDPHPPYLVPAPWDTMYDPAAMDVAGDHARRTREEPDPFPNVAGGEAGLHRVAQGGGRQLRARSA